MPIFNMTGGAGGAGGYTEALTVSTGVQNCRLTATMSAGDTVVGVTDEGGYATMEIPTGVEFIVRVQPPDGYLVPDPQTVTMIYGTPQNMTFALIQSAVISVTVTDEKTEGGAGAVGATVKISQNGDVIETKTTDSLAKASFTVAPGTYSITGTAADGETMLSSSEVTVAGGMTSSVTLKVVYNIVYGFSIAVGTADPDARVTYPQTVFGQTNAAYGKTPCTNTSNSFKINGFADCELISGIKRQTYSGGKWTDVSDKRKAVAGSASNEVYTYIPTWYMKMTNDGTNIICAFSMEQIDSTWKDYAGSVGSNHVGHFRLGCYACKSDFKSYSGQPKVSTNITGFISGCQKLGTGYDIMTWYQWTYLAALAVLLYKSTNLQAAMASGYVSGSSVQSESALTFTNDYGMAGTPGNTGTTQMAFFWIQNLWGNMSQFVGGAKTSSYKLMTCTGYSSTDEADFDKKSLGGPSSNISGAIKTVVGTTDAGFFPTDCSGSYTTYFADYGNVNYSNFPLVGGYYGSDDRAGPLHANFYPTDSNTNSSVGSRLSYRL